MPRRSKIDLEKVKASLASRCPQCGNKIEPHELLRIDNVHVRCPKCLAAVTPTKRENSRPQTKFGAAKPVQPRSQ